MCEWRQSSALLDLAAGSGAAAAAARPRVVLNISLFHFLTRVSVYLCTYVGFGLGEGVQSALLGTSPPSEHSCDDIISSVRQIDLCFTFPASQVRFRTREEEAGWSQT